MRSLRHCQQQSVQIAHSDAATEAAKRKPRQAGLRLFDDEADVSAQEVN